MKNEFMGVLEENKRGVKMGKTKHIKQDHCRVSLSGIFDAHRCKIEKTLFYKRQGRGRSPITTFGDDGLCFYGQQTARVEDAEINSAITSFDERQLVRGFTLIELLVVVLIIGILAAVALPQYQRAVLKSRATEAILTLQKIHQAQTAYYLANGQITTDLSKLDIEIKEGFYTYLCREGGSCYAYSKDEKTANFEQTFTGDFLCRGSAEKCKPFSSQLVSSSGSGNPSWVMDLN